MSSTAPDQCLDALYAMAMPNGFVATTAANSTAASSNSAIAATARPDHRRHHLRLHQAAPDSAIYLMTQDKKGVSARSCTAIGCLLHAAWRQTQADADGARSTRSARSYLGGRSGGKRGRRYAPGKTPFVAAVETEQGHPLRMKLTVVEGFRLTEIAAWAQLHLGTGTRVVSDGLACFHGVTAAGCVHEPVVVGSGKAAVEAPSFDG